MYILTYNIQIKKNSLTASATLVEKKYRSSWFTVQVLMMSHSISFHSVYFELSTVPQRETIEGSRSLQSSSVFSRYPIDLREKNRNKSQKNRFDRLRFFPTWKIDLNGSIDTYHNRSLLRFCLHQTRRNGTIQTETCFSLPKSMTFFYSKFTTHPEPNGMTNVVCNDEDRKLPFLFILGSLDPWNSLVFRNLSRRGPSVCGTVQDI